MCNAKPLRLVSGRSRIGKSHSLYPKESRTENITQSGNGQTHLHIPVVCFIRRTIATRRNLEEFSVNQALELIGVVVIIIGFWVMVVHPHQRGGLGGRGNRASGPVWFLLVVLGIIILALGAYLPPS